MNCPKIWEKLCLVRSIPHTQYQGNMERRTSFFSLEFFSTNNNNFNLASYLKIFTQSSITISFNTLSPSINYTYLIIKIWNQIEVKDERNLLQEFSNFQNWEGVGFIENHNVDYENLTWNVMTKWFYMCLRLNTKMNGKNVLDSSQVHFMICDKWASNVK